MHSVKIAAIPRYAYEEIRIEKTIHDGKIFVDVRLWFFDDHDKTWKPTRKGVLMELTHFEHFKTEIANF